MERHCFKKRLLLQQKLQLANQNQSLKTVANLSNVSKFYGKGSIEVKALDKRPPVQDSATEILNFLFLSFLIIFKTIDFILLTTYKKKYKC